ncbi:MAG TPA: protein TolQ [Gammaproteobacteria bacterium]|nr:protein TolQ [Gammaproteobacteria bacterium]
MQELTLTHLVLNASLPVQIIMAILVMASVYSWGLILYKRRMLSQARRSAEAFEGLFRSEQRMSDLYQRVLRSDDRLGVMAAIFEAGYREFLHQRRQPTFDREMLTDNSARVMRVVMNRELDTMESSLSSLATIGSVSPYVGLFGTVWGIMSSFTALGNVQQATLAMVAPGIAEALFATAMGLFAAIPAVISYNRSTSEVGRLASRYESFIEEFISIMLRFNQPKGSARAAVQ